MSFVKDEKLLEESCEVEDLFDFKEEEAKLKSRLNSLRKSGILGFVGRFGCGKSTLLYNLGQKADSQDEQWIVFEAWKYPERSDLWEGFVLDIVGEVIDKKELNLAEKQIKGEQNDDKKALVKTLSKIPGFAVLEGFNHFLKTSPATRVNEIQEILEDSLDKLEKDLFIVLEDIDRSGDKGIYFLETLNQFLKKYKNKSGKKIIAIVPMGNKSFRIEQDSYQKCLDYVEFFDPKIPSLTNFFKRIIIQDSKNKLVDGSLEFDLKIYQATGFFEELFNTFKSQMTPRLLKMIIRNAGIYHQNMKKDGLNPDWRLSLMFSAMKFLKFKKRHEKTREFTELTEDYIFELVNGNISFSGSQEIKKIPDNSESLGRVVFVNFLNIILLLERISASELKIQEVEFVDNNSLNLPTTKSAHGDGRVGYLLGDFYLNY